MGTLSNSLLLSAAAFATAQVGAAATAEIDALATAGVPAAAMDEVAAAAPDRVGTESSADVPSIESGLASVEWIPALRRPHAWSVVGDDTLILWASPSRPYLVRLFRPSPELKFAWMIGVTSSGNQIHARFDSIEVQGFRYPIREIYKLSRDDADALKEQT